MSTSNAYTDEMRLLARAERLRLRMVESQDPEDCAAYERCLREIDERLGLRDERLEAA